MKQSLTQMFLAAEKEEAKKLQSDTGIHASQSPAPKHYLEGVWIVRPGQPIPEQFVDVLKTWKAVREHPAWKGHPQLK